MNEIRKHVMLAVAASISTVASASAAQPGPDDSPHGGPMLAPRSRPANWMAGAGIFTHGPGFGFALGGLGVLGAAPGAGLGLGIERRLSRWLWLRLGLRGAYTHARIAAAASEGGMEAAGDSLSIGGEVGPRVVFNPGDRVEAAAYLVATANHGRSTQAGGGAVVSAQSNGVGGHAGFAIDVRLTPSLVLRLSSTLVTVTNWWSHAGEATGSRSFFAGVQLTPGVSLYATF